jgi:UPF0755 protein|tara:strand:+ start:21010 stop:21963 length:954 start_codon:yes stop_codon:yes gene_type:complete
MYLIRFSLFLFILSISIYAPYKAFINDIPQKDDSILEVNSGETINDVFSKFLPMNYFNNFFSKIYLYFNDIRSIQTGEYQISNKSFSEIVSALQYGDTITYKLKINEGITIYELEKLINNSYLDNNCSFLKCIETDFPFKEGIMYPDTYFYKKGMQASEILIKSYERLNNYLNIKLNSVNKKTSLKKADVLILASIIEKEAGNNNEKLNIASVFLKRLSIGMRLQADPTIIYGLLPNFDGDIKKSDILDKNNKYNTYMIYGLPPSPISISSMSSIDAAIDAVPGDYLFFVADSPTSHYFSKSYDEHLEMINKLGLNK